MRNEKLSLRNPLGLGRLTQSLPDENATALCQSVEIATPFAGGFCRSNLVVLSEAKEAASNPPAGSLFAFVLNAVTP
jgi:hypothetical protein